MSKVGHFHYNWVTFYFDAGQDVVRTWSGTGTRSGIETGFRFRERERERERVRVRVREWEWVSPNDWPENSDPG